MSESLLVALLNERITAASQEIERLCALLRRVHAHAADACCAENPAACNIADWIEDAGVEKLTADP